MGVHTTLDITRDAAIAKLSELRGDRAPTNRELEDELDMRLEHTLYNFHITLDETNNDDETLAYLQGKP